MAPWTARIIGALCLLGLAAIAGLAGWSRSVALTDSRLSLRIYPGQSAALLVQAEELRASEKIVSKSMAETSTTLLRRAPLLDAPLVYSGLRLAAKGEERAAKTFFLAALRRQPRNVPALSWLAGDAVRNDQLNEAAGFLDRLFSLNPKEKIYPSVLASIIAREGTEDILKSRLAAASPLAEQALEELNASSNDIGLLLRLNAHWRKGQSQLIQRLFAEQGPTQAFIAWLALAPELDARSISWPIDPVFVGIDAPHPFNWEVFEGAELLSEGGLYVSFSGRGQHLFVRQTMMLSPGHYLFSAEMDGEMTAAGGKFEWAIQCYGEQNDLGLVLIRDLSATPLHNFDFDVPLGRDCSAQILVLRGRPGEFPARARTTVRKVSIQSVSAR
jgi:hypothetical protein